jgi:protein phosphatase
MTLESWAGSHIGLVRKSNQDSLGCYPELRLFIVADGMGGHAEGEVASRLAIEILHDTLRLTRSDNPPPPTLRSRWQRLLRPDPGNRPDPRDLQNLRSALTLANKRIFEAGAPADAPAPARRMGSTAVVLAVALEAQRAYWAHVGDSRLYRWRRGRLQLLTADHTLHGARFGPGDEIPVDLPHTNVLQQALGPQEQVDVAVGSDLLEVGDQFLLCSDGISGLIGAAVIGEILAQESTLAANGERLIQAALDAGGRDNASAILVRVSAD